MANMNLPTEGTKVETDRHYRCFRGLQGRIRCDGRRSTLQPPYGVTEVHGRRLFMVLVAVI
jgi:hypothetical protein